jgi:hypothetical protein
LRIKPEDLKLANTVASIKESSGNTAKKNYWNGVHLLVTKPGTITLKTTDGSFWIEWHIPTEGPTDEWQALIKSEALDCAARYLDGGSFEVSRQNRVISLTKGEFSYPLREETPQTYPEPRLGENPTTWTVESKPLSDNLKFVAAFIDETNPNANKSIATLFSNGQLSAGNPTRHATVNGLTAPTDMSFKTRAAKAVANFISRIGDNVEITVTDSTYQFRDPAAGHSLVLLSEPGRFKRVGQDLSNKMMEIITVDRKTLYQRAQIFQGALRENIDRINCALRGENEQSSLRVSTPDDEAPAHDEFGVYRTFVPRKIETGEVDTQGNKTLREETPEEVEARKGPVEFALGREALASTLAAMEGTSIILKYYGRFLLIQDEIARVDGQPTGPEKTVLMQAKTLAAARLEEELAARKRLEEEAAAKVQAEREAAEAAAKLQQEKDVEEKVEATKVAVAANGNNEETTGLLNTQPAAEAANGK